MNSLTTQHNYPKRNIDDYIRHHHGAYLLYVYRSVKKLYYRSEAVRLDISFLKTCRSKDIIPTFLLFKTANHHLSSSSVYRDCQRRFLNVEIDWKYKELYRLKTIYESSFNLLRELAPTDLVNHLYEMVLFHGSRSLQKKEETLNDKLLSLCPINNSTGAYNPKVVTNFSSRELSNEEILHLANGLDYSLPVKYVDSMNIASNVETFFHRVTDVYQHHKKFMNENKGNEAIDESDVRVLNTKELSLASDLSSLTKTFMQKADRCRLQKNKSNSNEENYRKLLQKLKEDTSIIITRPDKGRGVVLLNRQDYVNKMLTILSDSSKFCLLSEDPTITRENNLISLLRKLHDQKCISDEFYYTARPIGSNPGRLYGLPKVHKEKVNKENVSLRPVLSSIRTFNYGLAKALTQMLSHLIDQKNIVRDSSSFVKDLDALDGSVSFQVLRLFLEK